MKWTQNLIEIVKMKTVIFCAIIACQIGGANPRVPPGGMPTGGPVMTQQQMYQLLNQIAAAMPRDPAVNHQPVPESTTKNTRIINKPSEETPEECKPCHCHCAGCRLELDNVTVISDITELSPLLSQIKRNMVNEACDKATDLPIKLTKVQKYILQLGYGVFLILALFDQCNWSKKRKLEKK